MTRLKKKYQEEVAPALMKKFNYKSVMQIPRLEKIVVNVGCGDARDNMKALDAVVRDITTITGQKASSRKPGNRWPTSSSARACRSALRLRSARINVGVHRQALQCGAPRVRDFHGISANSFDGRGNYALGVKEQLIFPEIDYDKIEKIRGLDIVICTTAKTDEESRELLNLLGAPFIQA